MEAAVPVLVKYSGPATERGIDFAVLGNSFMGVDQLLHDLFAVSKINGTLEVRTERIEPGSVNDYINLYVTVNGLPFDNPVYLYEFLRIAAPELVARAQEVISTAKTAHDGLKAFYNEFEAELYILPFLIIALRKKGLMGRIGKRVESLRKAGRFKRALAPLQENGYDAIRISQHNVDDGPMVTIADSDLPDYLPVDDQILPSLQNGQTVTLGAKVVGLSSQKGEVVILRVSELGEQAADFRAYPPDGEGTQDLKEYYGQEVSVTALVVRKNNNMYKKPEFNILSIDYRQVALDIFEEKSVDVVGEPGVAGS